MPGGHSDHVGMLSLRVHGCDGTISRKLLLKGGVSVYTEDDSPSTTSRS